MAIQATMRAVRLHPPGDVAHLRLDEVEVPSPGPGEVLVRVHAAAITRGELEWPVDRLPAIRLTSFRALSSAAVTRYMRSRLSIATAWLPSTPSSQPMCLHRSPCG